MEFNFNIQKYSLNTLRAMEVIDINTGRKLGYIRDFVIDCDDYKVKSLLIPANKATWFAKESVYEIEWEKIHKIGVDVILIDADEIVKEMKIL